MHRDLADVDDSELKQIPVLETGVRLRQGATYLDLNPGGGQLTATGDMQVRSGQVVVAKDRVP